MHRLRRAGGVILPLPIRGHNRALSCWVCVSERDPVLAVRVWHVFGRRSRGLRFVQLQRGELLCGFRRDKRYGMLIVPRGFKLRGGRRFRRALRVQRG